MVVELGKRLEILELVMWEPVRKLVEDFLNEECVSYSIAPEDGALTGRGGAEEEHEWHAEKRRSDKANAIRVHR